MWVLYISTKIYFSDFIAAIFILAFEFCLIINIFAFYIVYEGR